jgi:hypothetical protein
MDIAVFEKKPVALLLAYLKVFYSNFSLSIFLEKNPCKETGPTFLRGNFDGRKFHKFHCLFFTILILV